MKSEVAMDEKRGRRRRMPTQKASTPMESEVVGTVGGFQARTESGGQFQNQVWTFRVERFDAEGNRLQPIPVEIRFREIRGFISEGDRVRIPIGRWRPGELLSPSRFFNETTRSEVKAGPSGVTWRDLWPFYLFPRPPE